MELDYKWMELDHIYTSHEKSVPLVVVKGKCQICSILAFDEVCNTIFWKGKLHASNQYWKGMSTDESSLFIYSEPIVCILRLWKLCIKMFSLQRSSQRYFFKANNGNTTKMYGIYSKLMTKTSEWHLWIRSGV